ncbi:MAG: hypothetical protein KIT80_04845 [Chitinophagaceae bacterium]|nr:hypothetical protein [Chitinophagaceae bacterium]MCW5926220.1 hypothetical protein [Chitinophagaceae bacterium]
MLFKKILPLVLALYSCNTSQPETYAIKDFRKTLQPGLIKAVNNGIVSWDSTFQYIATDNELRQLASSEHPIIRAIALHEMLVRNKADHYNIVKDNLADTAIIAVDRGEFGWAFETVADHLIEWAYWNTKEELDETIRLVVSKHNYLQSAYLILPGLEPQEELYPFIKDMATRPRKLSGDGYEMGFRDIEYALKALAKFKKQEDIQTINQVIKQNHGFLTYNTLELIRDFPDTSYFEILQRYHRYSFYQFSGYRRGGFTGFPVDNADPEDFIDALFAQRTEKSALLLDTMLLYLDHIKHIPDRDGIKEKLVMKIWEDSTAAYTGIRKKVEKNARAILKQREQYDSAIGDPIEIEPFRDTTPPRYSWRYYY